MSHAVKATRRHRKPLLVAAAFVVVVAGLGLWWFQPYKLLIDDKVDEALPAMPTVPGAGGGGAGAGAQPATPPVVARGTVIGLSHRSSGEALVLELPDGSRLLRFEDLKTDNGPDLRVYLSAAPAGGPGSAHNDDFVDLGGLKGNVGNQNYELPAGVDLARYRTAVVWCRRFSVGFAAADLS